MIATTIEQGKKLIESGVSADTADMYAQFFPNEQCWHYEARDNNDFEDTVKNVLCNEDEFFYAWSLSKLIELCPEHIPYRIIRTRGKDIEGIFEDLVEYLSSYKENPILEGHGVQKSWEEIYNDGKI